MYVKSIVLDGFKSYGNRVEITGFDPEFNAITGLNGTGKSNILDSICFVLGITNLSNVRAGSLQELIYKHGQAGITKATVSITFDNRDKKQCPIGYENHDEITVTRQVVMGGKNKYLINGINVQNKRVSDLFCSVQLNVNNPHFLIMQGRITKVLNMKPPEILSMVEEAAGTRMYEAKKQAAQKTIEKKDAKLRELNDIIVEDVAPKLQKLQDERAQFQEYQKVLRELENLTRLNVAYKYVTAEEKTKEAEGKVTEVQNDIKAKKDTIEENKKEAKNLDKQVAELNKKLDEESGSILKDLEAQLLEVEKTEASSSAAHKAAKEALATHEKRAKLMDKALRDDEVALAEKEKELDKVSSTFSALEAASSQGSATLQTAQQAFLAASAGRGETGGSLQTMLIEAKQAASEASTRVSAGGMQKRHLSERLRTLEREFAANAARFQADQEDIGRQQAEVDKLKSQLSRSSHSAEQLSALATSVRQEQAALRVARDRRDTLAARLQRCQLVYTDPEAGFDRRRVHGTVCRLISVRDPKYCTALETAAGGRLYNVVVDTEVTSKLLLTRGRLQTRTTIIPLNKITAQGIDAGTLNRARQLGGGADKVQLALDLVDFDPVVRPAIVWVLGGTLVCADLDVARRVAFSDVRRRCVTMDGDVVDPAGTLTGGARSQGGSVLVQLKELKEMEQTVQRLESELADHSAELHVAQRDADTHARAQQRYEQASYELEVIKARLANTTHAQTHKEIEALRAQVAELTEAIEKDKVIQKESAAKAKELEEQVKDIKGHREREFKKAEAALKKAKEDFETHNNRWKQHEQESAALQLEVEELRRAVAGARGGAGAARGEGERLKGELGRKGDDLRAATEAVKEVQARIKRQKNEISARNTDIARLHQNKEQLAKKNGELELNIKELQYTITELQTEAAECEKRMSSLSRAHVWLSTEREFFGLPGGVYDFTARRADLCGQRLAQLQERRDKLARGLNARAHTLLASEEEQYNDVMRKKRIVEADRAKLVQVMAELDDKKRKTLVAACEQVNKDFGSIFSTLLPGAQAKLKPRDGLTVLDGLEVKVGFNNTWKDSLGELSGGQRSLVALSLVLAMLLFHPAPLYILDEVDAALDLEHTQNIGLMLRNHFRHSQFIIVSLKNGMFNNANVLFSTKFVDGMSSVSRTVNSRR